MTARNCTMCWAFFYFPFRLRKFENDLLCEDCYAWADSMILRLTSWKEHVVPKGIGE